MFFISLTKFLYTVIKITKQYNYIINMSDCLQMASDFFILKYLYTIGGGGSPPLQPPLVLCPLLENPDLPCYL